MNLQAGPIKSSVGGLLALIRANPEGFTQDLQQDLPVATGIIVAP